MDYVPARGDVAWLTLDPQSGREQAGRRPVLVLSPLAYNQRVGLAVVCPITTVTKGYVFEVAIPAGMPAKGVILSDHVKNLDWRTRNVELICRLPRPIVEDVIEKLAALLEIGSGS
jgi:mRNA interferase MazF